MSKQRFGGFFPQALLKPRKNITRKREKEIPYQFMR
jgi:hypothetical protein